MARSLALFLSVSAVAAAIPLSGCTRTYDGSVVPLYQTRLVRAGLMPHVAIVRSRTEPHPGIEVYSFPSPPPASPRAAPDRRRVRKAMVRRFHPEPTPAPSLVCRQDQSPSGRVRVVCR